MHPTSKKSLIWEKLTCGSWAAPMECVESGPKSRRLGRRKECDANRSRQGIDQDRVRDRALSRSNDAADRQPVVSSEQARSMRAANPEIPMADEDERN